jgi:hypothetical protein
LDRVNEEFEDDGLYMSHLFDEDQVVLTPEWRDQRVPVEREFRKLCVHRLSDIDLMLSKTMRYDPIDLGDLRFIIERAALAPDTVAEALGKARIPDCGEIVEQVQLCRDWLVREGLCAKISP